MNDAIGRAEEGGSSIQWGEGTIINHRRMKEVLASTWLGDVMKSVLRTTWSEEVMKKTVNDHVVRRTGSEKRVNDHVVRRKGDEGFSHKTTN
jgi:hypothetical protein